MPQIQRLKGQSALKRDSGLVEMSLADWQLVLDINPTLFIDGGMTLYPGFSTNG
jgi:hypothetical protein